jgi:hypothetical protein
MQATIRRLPLPMHVGQVLAMVDQKRPDVVEDAPLIPALQRSMHGRIAPELFGQLIPLTACSTDIPFLPDK